MKLISDKLCTDLENLMGLCFLGNRIADRCQSQLDVKFVMPNTAKIIHLGFAHQMPLLADYIGDYCKDRGYAVNYPDTPKDYTDYASSREIFDKLLEYMVDLETQTSNVIDIAESERDTTTSKALSDFLSKLVYYTKLTLSLVDYSERNGCTPKDDMDMDSRVNNFLQIND